MKSFILWIVQAFKSKPGDWMDKPGKEQPAAAANTAYVEKLTQAYQPEKENEDVFKPSNPVAALFEAVKNGKASVVEANIFEGFFDERGKLLRESEILKEKGGPKYRMVRVSGNDAFKSKISESERIFKFQPVKAKESREAKIAALKKIRESEGKTIEADGFLTDEPTIQYDPNQYTEYTPVYGGPHFKQLYLYDMQLMMSRAFEAANHNPLARRIVDVFSQYSLGRGFKAKAKDNKIQEIWDEFESENNICQRMRKFWVRELITYGEIMIDNKSWKSIDPSTVWDIVTDPDDINDVYYYFQSYPTAYQQFSGRKVPGVAGSDKTVPIEYVVREIPYDQIIHIKSKCLSNEKRGRSWLFPILGWLKRVKDLYNAEVVRAWLQATLVWDDTIKGSDTDIQAHVDKYQNILMGPSIFAHNEAIERKAVQATGGAQSGTQGVGAEILSFIATCVGIPKDFFNVVGSGFGSRATSLISSEPFTKAIEELQMEFEQLLHEIAKTHFSRFGIELKKGDLEFIFPSVAKDTTTEMVSNIAKAEALGYLSKRTASMMAAAEMNITTYDFENEQKQIAKDQTAGLDKATGMNLPPGRYGDLAKNPVNGQGRLDLERQLKSL